MKKEAFKKVCESEHFFDYELEDMNDGGCFCLKDGVYKPLYVFTTNKNFEKANYTTKEELHLIHLKNKNDLSLLDEPLTNNPKKYCIKSQIEFDGFNQVTVYENLGTNISEIVVELNAANMWLFLSTNFFKFYYKRFDDFNIVVVLGA